MSNRDKQFQGFAKALWDELEQAMRQDPGFIPEGSTRRAMYIPLWQQIIARRAYDLVEHAVSETIGTSDVTHVPDMTEWPTEG